LKPKKPTKIPVSIPTLVASSTPQRPTTATKTRASPVVEIQDDEALLDEVLAADQDDDNDSEGLNNFDAAQGTDEDEQTTNVSIRQRRANK
jgi:hypothetical protein